MHLGLIVLLLVTMSATHGDGATFNLEAWRAKKFKEFDLEMPCGETQLIQPYQACNGVVECTTKMDESYIYCSRLAPECPESAFRCSYGACIPLSDKCNNVTNCADASDELHPDCFKHTRLNETKQICSASEYSCRDGRQCIPLRTRCNGVLDCHDGSDETVLECSQDKCPPNTLRCAYGACAPDGAFCDLFMDCHDFSDESLLFRQVCYRIQRTNSCHDSNSDPAYSVSTALNKDVFYQFPCRSEDQCVPLYQRCNGPVDCRDGSDETEKCKQFRQCPLIILPINSFASIDCKPPRCTVDPVTKNVTTGSMTQLQCRDKLTNFIIKEFEYQMCYNGEYYETKWEDCRKQIIMYKLQEPVGGTARLLCSLRRVEVRWFRRATEIREIQNSERYWLERDGNQLVIANLTESDIGRYSCRSENGRTSFFLRVGDIPYDSSQEDVLDDDAEDERSSSGGVIAAVAVISILLTVAVIILILYIFWRRQQRKLQKKILGLAGRKGSFLQDETVPLYDQAADLPYDKKWEFPKDLLKFDSQLGAGAFGVVMRAEARGINRGEESTTVAVKMVRPNSDLWTMKALATELKVLIHLGHHVNIVNLLGASTKCLRKGELYVIVEYCPLGNLHDYLIKNRHKFREEEENQNEELGPEYANTTSQPGQEDASWSYNMQGESDVSDMTELGTKTLLCWAFQVARGMEYLSGRRIIHGDLATRNILLAQDSVAKICDFGLARSLYNNAEYHKKGDAPVPLKWLAIESVHDGVFSTQSDVWAFGITLWEMFSLGMIPYPGLGEYQQIFKMLREGYRMEKPKYADTKVYQIMKDCWHDEPSNRPTFVSLVDCMGRLLEYDVREYYVQLNEESLRRSKLVDDGYLRPRTSHYVSSPRPSIAPVSNVVNLHN